MYDIKAREDMRESLGLAGRLVIGHVGSFRTPKNHVFLLDVFAEIYKRNPAARLILVGEGPLMPEIKEKQNSSDFPRWFFYRQSVQSKRLLSDF